MLVREHLAGAAETVDHLIDVQQQPVFAAQAFDLRQVLVRRHCDADAAMIGSTITSATGWTADAERRAELERGTDRSATSRSLRREGPSFSGPC